MSLGTVISAERKKQKKPRQQAAHKMIIFGSAADFSQTDLICLRTEGVIGSLSGFSSLRSHSLLLIPARVYYEVRA